MAITYVQSVCVAANNPTSASWSLPTGWAQDDIGIFWWSTLVPTKTITQSSVTERANVTLTGGGRLFIGYRILQTGDTTFAWTSSTQTNATTLYGCSAFRGVDISTPFDVADPAKVDSGAPPLTVIDVPDVVTVTASCMVICIAQAGDDTTSNPPTAPSIGGSAGTIDNTGAGATSWLSSTTGSDASFALAYREVGAAGTQTCTSFTMAIANGAAQGYTMALRPVVAAALVQSQGFANHSATAVLMGGIRRAWHRRGSGIFVPELEGVFA